MASSKLEVSDFDFDNIKSNLKTFLQSQTEFQDYNFEGSGFAILLDILAYNTHYLGFNANMLVNEIYLDSADIRKNIVSLAKMLGYTPTSVRSPKANIKISVNDATGPQVTLLKGTVFTTNINGNSYQYLTNENYVITPVDGLYIFPSVEIYEGTLVTYRYTVDVNDADQKFIIPSENADMSTLKVSVQNSSNDTTTSVYSLAGGYNNVTNISKIYFLQESEDGKFEIYFGDGVLGEALQNENIIILEYIVTNKSESNSASAFSLATTIDGFSNVSIVINSISQGGSAAESKESIRFNAPLNYAAQNRAVTTSDYETIIRSIYPNALSVSAWGGEDEEPPIYGVVKISIKPTTGSILTETTKNNIITSLKPFNVASIRPQIVDPEITKVLITTTAKYDQKLTTKNEETLQTIIFDALTEYNTNVLQKFDGIFRFSKVTKIIDETDNSLVSNITTIKIKKTFTPVLNTTSRYNIFFRNSFFNPNSGYNEANGGILESSGFKVSGDNTFVYFLDDDGAGNIRRYRLLGSQRIYVNNAQGEINYELGQITLNSLQISTVENIRGNPSSIIELIVKPKSNDIVPVRNQIIEIDLENSIINVEADTFIGGASDAGVGYTTTSSN